MYWDFLWTRKQRFMNSLSRPEYGNKILYVEPTFSVKEKLLDPGVKNKGIAQIKKINENLSVLTPPLWVPFGRFEAIRKLNHRQSLRSIQKWQRNLGLQHPMLWTYRPDTASLLGAFSEKFVVYDCVDEHSAYPGRDKRLVQQQEDVLVSRADCVFVSARGLYERRKRLNPDTFFIPNGVDFPHLRKAQDPATEIPEFLKSLKRPILGFVGGIADWIDLDLVRYIARARPDYSIVLVGPVTRHIDLKPFHSLPNVFFPGPKDRMEIPAYLKGFDVCLNIFKLNELSQTVNPLKVYEYLAAGRPVVSVNMPEIHHFKDIIWIARDEEEFVDGIDRALKDPSPEKIQEGIRRVQEYSWDSLLNQVVEILNKILKRKGKI